MGTRSLTKFNMISGDSKKPMAVIYTQLDGYPSWLGKRIHGFLKSRELVNGFNSSHDASTTSNGAGDLVAQYIHYAKQDSLLGGVYIETIDAHDIGESYVYAINFHQVGSGFLVQEKLHSIEVTSSFDGKTTVFNSGDTEKILNDFEEFCSQ